MCKWRFVNKPGICLQVHLYLFEAKEIIMFFVQHLLDSHLNKTMINLLFISYNKEVFLQQSQPVNHVQVHLLLGLCLTILIEIGLS